MTERNARFWVSVHDSPVKLTLRPGQEIEVYYRGPTDEGWSSWYEKWSYEDGIVYREWCDDGRDCDGRLTRGGQDCCPLELLDSGSWPYVEHEPPEVQAAWEGVRWPAWQDAQRYQRDEFAEMAGY